MPVAFATRGTNKLFLRLTWFLTGHLKVVTFEVPPETQRLQWGGPVSIFPGLRVVSLRCPSFSNRKSLFPFPRRVAAQSFWIALLAVVCGSAHAQAPMSDNFDEGNLNTSLWFVKAPAGGSAALTGGQLVITVPGGSDHQAYTPLNAVRVIQAVSNANFDVYVKINSQLTASAQQTFAGLLVGGDASNYIYYQAYSDGSNVNLLCASIDAGAQNIRINTIPFTGYPVPTYLRLARAGTTYTAYWSADAVTWTSAGSFNDGLTVTHLGPFAGNNNTTPANAPPISAAIGGFENTPAAGTTATPTFTPPSGTSFSSSLSVTINDGTTGARIYYTTNGDAPTTSSTPYGGAFTLTSSTTVNAIAVANGIQSAVGSASYTLSAGPTATPTFTPPSGTSFSSSLSVSINDGTTGARIYYTTNGDAPTTSSTPYGGPFTLTSSTTVNAIAVANGVQSAVGSASYTLSAGTTATPTFTPPSGTSFSSSLSVTIQDGTTGAKIYYTTNGDAPTTSSTPYGGAFTLTASATVNAIAVANGSQSTVGSASYTLSAGGGGGGAPVPDEFSGSSINSSVWTVRTPVGGSAAVSNGELVLTVPAGSNHDAFVPALDAVQLVQPIANQNFDVAVKIDSTLVGGALYNGQGLLVEGDASNYIRYELAALGNVSLTVLTVSGGSQTSRINLSPFSGYPVPTYLRLARAGTTYTAYYSADGNTWTTAGSFSDSVTVTGLAPYAWNYNSTPSKAPALTAKFDWFHNVTGGTQSPAATPTFTPSSGTDFASTLSVSIGDTSPNPTVHYTTDGSMPTTNSPVYGGPFTISASTTVYAIATAPGFTQSATGSASYTFTGGGGGGTGGVVSDNFDEGSLNTSLWSTENPLGDGIVTMNGTAATLNVPQGKIHDLTGSGDNALRIMQPVGNSDFSVDVRFQSVPEIGNQDEGILVEQDSTHFVRFDVSFNGTQGPKLFAAGVNGSQFTTFVSTQFSLGSAPLFLRLARSGDVWTGSWSTNGTNFTASPSFTFDLNAARVGPFAGTNASSAFNSPAFTAIVDYFFATSDPIANQDGPKPYSYATVDANPPGTVVEKTLMDIQGTGQLEPVIGTEVYSSGGNNSNGGIYWYSYPTSGGVQGTWTRHTIIGNGNAYEDMEGLDVNGDGAVDLVASYNNSSGVYQIVWFENPRGQGGDPTQPWAQHAIGAGYGENNLDLADIDGDGKMDMVTPSSIFFQNSADSWTQVKYSGSFRGVAVLDIGSGKGRINLTGTGPSPNYNIVWYENPRETGGNARTGQWILHTIGTTPYPCQNSNQCTDSGDVAAYQTLDVNEDGKVDVISGQSEGPQYGAPAPGGLIWWQAPLDRRNGAWIKHTIDANMIDVHKIATGDMDKNGSVDIIIAEQDQAPLRRVVVYYNNGGGSLTPEIISNAEGHNLCVGDVTHSGTLEIFNSGHGYFLNTHPLQIFLNPY